MPGPRYNRGHLMKMHVFLYDDCNLVAVDLQGVLNICTHVGLGRGGTL